MPDEAERPGSFAQHFLGRASRRPPRYVAPEPPPAGEHTTLSQLGLFGAADAEGTPPDASAARHGRRAAAADAADAVEALASSAAAPGRQQSTAASAEQDSSPPANDLGPPLAYPPPAEPGPRIWSVRALVADLRARVESRYTGVSVEGEISNCRPAPSGHLYLTLKDGEAQLPVVLFRREAQLLRFRPVDGLAVLVRGRLSVYESRGQLQIIAESMEPRGAGALQLAFDQLKARLLAEGLFDSARKRSLPPYPRCIGVITSPAGAVLRDIVSVVERRHACLNLLVYPVPVQGDSCAGAVVRAIRWFNRHPERADLLLLARGGGSLEDFAGFNDEAVARAIAASDLPVVSAIGHETDFTIADFVADLRAPTPSAAAELITAAQHRVAERIDALAHSLRRSGRYRLLEARQRFARLSTAHVLARVFDGIALRQQRLDDLRQRLALAAEQQRDRRARRFERVSERLERQSPNARLTGSVTRLQTLRGRLGRGAPTLLDRRRAEVAQLASRLHALSPLAVLGRGYALVYGPGGALISSAGDLRPGDAIRARLAQGSVQARVTDAEVNNEPGSDPQPAETKPTETYTQ